MKILVVGSMDPDSFADNVRHALTGLGHEACTTGPAAQTTGQREADAALSLAAQRFPRLNAIGQRHILRRAAAFRPDLTVTVDSRLSADVIAGLHDLGSPVYLWFPDAVSNLGRHDVFLAGYDRIYLKNPLLVHQLSAVHGLPVRYLPEACTPDWHRAPGLYGESGSVALVGNIHPTRAILLSRLANAGIPLALYGPPIRSWVGHPGLAELHTGQFLRREHKAAVFRAATAVLNNLHPAEFGGTNCRLFEATAAGGLVLTEEREGLSQLFEPGREVLTFTSFDELVGLYRAAVDDPAWARGIADAGAARSLRDHTYEKRLTAMLES